jgi:F-type H+-transporting ATPase subunit epsilon
MQPDAIQLVIVTPERQLLSERVVEVTLPGADGELGVLPGHAPLITELGIGELRYRTAGGAMSDPIAVIRGFAEVLQDRVTVLAETAERAEEIDIERAKAALERAEKRIAAGAGATDIDWDRATAALQRAMVRLKVAEYAPRRRSAVVTTP